MQIANLAIPAKALGAISKIDFENRPIQVV
jgi:hypothetical protein